jgi:hypothetical protein
MYLISYLSNAVYCRVLVTYPWVHAANWELWHTNVAQQCRKESCHRMPAQEKIKIKIQSMFFTEYILFSYHVKSKKILNWTIISWEATMQLKCFFIIAVAGVCGTQWDNNEVTGCLRLVSDFSGTAFNIFSFGVSMDIFYHVEKYLLLISVKVFKKLRMITDLCR